MYISISSVETPSSSGDKLAFAAVRPKKYLHVRPSNISRPAYKAIIHILVPYYVHVDIPGTCLALAYKTK